MKSQENELPFLFLILYVKMYTSEDVSSFIGAGVGVGVEFGVDSVDGGPSVRFSSDPFSLSLRSKSYCLSTILLNVSSSTAGLQCWKKYYISDIFKLW